MPVTAQQAVETAHTWLFVPGDRPERFQKASAAGADVVVLDLEDAVAPPNKDAARDHVVKWLSTAEATCAVRVNAADTSWHAADLNALAALPSDRPCLVMLAKAEDPQRVADVAATLPGNSVVIALVVQGPLSIIVLAEALRLAVPDQAMARLRRRNYAPLFCGDAASVELAKDPSAAEVTLCNDNNTLAVLSARLTPKGTIS
jgi:citrate lyase beta subunit